MLAAIDEAAPAICDWSPKLNIDSDPGNKLKFLTPIHPLYYIHLLIIGNLFFWYENRKKTTRKD